MTTSEKLAYLKGILAATDITDTQTKRIYDAVVDLLESIVEDVEFNAQNIDNIDSRLSEVDEDLELVESILYDDDADEAFEEEYEDDEYDYSEDDFEEDDEDFDAEAYLAQITAELGDEDDLDEEDELDDEFEEDELDDDFEEEATEEETSEPAEADEEEIYDDEYLEDEEGEAMYEIECPACHETIYLQESVILDGGVDCPNCGEPLEFDIEFEEE